MLFYGIKKGLKINVRCWINSNIRHTIRQGFGGIPYPTLLMELIASQGIDTTGQEVLQPKSLLNLKAIERIVTLEMQHEGTRASSSGTRAPRPARPSQPQATITDLARVVERQEAQIQGMRNWMATKVAYDHSASKVLRAQVQAINLRVGMDPSPIPQMPSYLEQLSRPWEPEEPPHEEDDEEDDDE